MSWIQKNYEKAFLGGALIVAAGISFVGYSALSSVEADFQSANKGAGNNDTAIESATTLKQVVADLGKAHELPQATVGSRSVDVFVGVPLFAKKSEGNGQAKPVDLLNDADVHAGIKNTWWIEYGIDPGYADSPDRDQDNDGFSNRDEYDAKTNPIDPKSFPSLVTKLKYVKDKSLQFLLSFSSSIGPQQYQFKYADSTDASKTYRTKEFIGDGGTLFTEGPCKDRFRLKKVETKTTQNEKTGINETIEWAFIEDLRPNKVGRIYEIPRRLRDSDLNKYYQYDRTAVLNLAAIGEGGKEFEVEEYTSFSLPFNKGDKKYRLILVSPESITVEWKDADGKTQQLEIKKSA